jgi:hypothetical protein
MTRARQTAQSADTMPPVMAEILSAAIEALDIPFPMTIKDGERYLHIRSERATHLVIALLAIQGDPAGAGSVLAYLRAQLTQCLPNGYEHWCKP